MYNIRLFNPLFCALIFTLIDFTKDYANTNGWYFRSFAYNMRNCSVKCFHEDASRMHDIFTIVKILIFVTCSWVSSSEWQLSVGFEKKLDASISLLGIWAYCCWLITTIIGIMHWRIDGENEWLFGIYQSQLSFQNRQWMANEKQRGKKKE